MTYIPTAADRAFRDAHKAGADDFTLASRMQSISDASLAVLAYDNADQKSAAFKAMVDAEAARRGFDLARRANILAKWSLGFAVLSIIVSIITATI